MGLPIEKSKITERVECVIDLVREHLHLQEWNIHYRMELICGEWCYLIYFKLDTWCCQITLIEDEVKRSSLFGLASGVISCYQSERKLRERK